MRYIRPFFKIPRNAYRKLYFILAHVKNILRQSYANPMLPFQLMQDYCNLLPSLLRELPINLTERKENNAVNNENRHECDVCHKTYKNKRHLYRHQKGECIGVEPKFKCEVCFNMFRRKYHLSRHMINRHGIKDEFKSEALEALTPEVNLNLM